MGEYADMIIDGLVDEYTGEVIDGDAPGFPRHRVRKQRSKGGVGNETCPKCGKRFKTPQGVADHTRDVHSGRTRINGRLEKLSRDERIEQDAEWANNQMTVGDEQDFGA